jgi:hypothetical protein
LFRFLSLFVLLFVLLISLFPLPFFLILLIIISIVVLVISSILSLLFSFVFFLVLIDRAFLFQYIRFLIHRMLSISFLIYFVISRQKARDYRAIDIKEDLLFLVKGLFQASAFFILITLFFSALCIIITEQGYFMDYFY